MKKATVILVNWNGKDDTLNCLSTLLVMQTSIHTEILVVDNASRDDSVAVIKKQYPEVVVLEQKENTGFVGGNNAGIQRAVSNGSDYIWLVNNDTLVDPGALDALVMEAESRGDGIYGSKIFFAKGHEYHKDRYSDDQIGLVIWYAGGSIDWDNVYGYHRGVDEVDNGQYDTVEPTEYVTGCSMLITKKVIDTIGMLDQKYFSYLEDMEYCVRAKNAGFQIIYVPSSILWHNNAGSTGDPGSPYHDYYLTRNRMLFAAEHAKLRTKIAIMRDAIKTLVLGNMHKKRAILDAMLRRHGEYVWEKKR